MTINNALGHFAEILGDTVPEKELLSWLSEIENTVITEIADTHLCGDYETDPITEECDRERELFAPYPFSSLYADYAVMKNDLRVRDMQRYLNSAAVFAASYSSFADWMNRTFMPRGAKVSL